MYRMYCLLFSVTSFSMIRKMLPTKMYKSWKTIKLLEMV